MTTRPSLFSPRISPPPTQLSTLSLHDALPISIAGHGERKLHERVRQTPSILAREMRERRGVVDATTLAHFAREDRRSEEHTSELQSHSDLVCRLLLEKKKKFTPFFTFKTYLVG